MKKKYFMLLFIIILVMTGCVTDKNQTKPSFIGITWEKRAVKNEIEALQRRKITIEASGEIGETLEIELKAERGMINRISENSFYYFAPSTIGVDNIYYSIKNKYGNYTKGQQTIMIIKNSPPEIVDINIDNYRNYQIEDKKRSKIEFTFGMKDGDTILESNLTAKGGYVEKESNNIFYYTNFSNTKEDVFTITLKDEIGNLVTKNYTIEIIPNGLTSVVTANLNDTIRGGVEAGKKYNFSLEFDKTKRVVKNIKITSSPAGITAELMDDSSYIISFEKDGVYDIIIYAMDNNNNSTEFRVKADVFTRDLVYIVYMAADTADFLNGLNGGMYDATKDRAKLDLDEIKEADIDDKKVGVVILSDFYFKDILSSGIYTKEENTLKQLRKWNDVNTGSESTLENYLAYVKENFKAKKYILSFWGHGSGWRNEDGGDLPSKSIGLDKGVNGGVLNLWEIEKGIKNGFGRKFDIIFADACNMGGIEVAYQLKECSDTVVFSADMVPGNGTNYKKMLELINDNIEKSNIELAKNMCNIFYEEYKRINDWLTIAAFDLSKMDLLKSKFDSVCSYLYGNEEILYKMKDKIKGRKKEVFSYYFSEFSDLGTILNLVEEDERIDMNLKKAIKEFEETLIQSRIEYKYLNYKNDYSEYNYDKTSGISIYADLFGMRAERLTEYKNASSFARDTKWYNILNNYFKKYMK